MPTGAVYSTIIWQPCCKTYTRRIMRNDWIYSSYPLIHPPPITWIIIPTKTPTTKNTASYKNSVCPPIYALSHTIYCHVIAKEWHADSTIHHTHHYANHKIRDSTYPPIYPQPKQENITETHNANQCTHSTMIFIAIYFGNTHDTHHYAHHKIRGSTYPPIYPEQKRRI